MAVALSIFIARKPHFSQAPPWPLLLASCLEAIIDGLIRFMADLTLSYIMALFRRRKTRLGFDSVGFPKFQLKLFRKHAL
jgi:hypothetical protein